MIAYLKQIMLGIALALMVFSALPCTAQNKTASTEELEAQLNTLATSDAKRIDILASLTFRYLSKDNQKSITCSEQAIDLARQLNSPRLADILVSAGGQRAFLSKHEDAATLLAEGLELARRNNQKRVEVKALGNLAALYDGIGQGNKAAKYAIMSHDVAVQLNDTSLVASSTMNLGVTYLFRKMYPDALKLLKASLNRLKETQDWRFYATAYLNIGDSYREMHDYPNSMHAYDTCSMIVQQHNLRELLGILAYSKAELQRVGFGQTDEAITILNGILADKNVDLDPLDRSRVYQCLAKAYMSKKDYSAAINNLLLSSENAVVLGITKEFTFSNDKLLGNCYNALGDTKEALKYFKQSLSTRDTLDKISEENIAISDLITHKIESKEKELTEKNNQLKVRQTVYETVGALLVPLLIILAVAVYYRIKLSRSKERVKLQAAYTQDLEVKVTERTLDLELAHKDIQEANERENISLAMLNQQHSELLEITIEKMQNWQKQTTITEIQPTINDLRAAKTKADEWGSFMLHFERIHPNFAKSLQVQFPELNANDLRHCAYMRLGMTRKQVADSLHSTDNAVKLARNRIRKKLGLEADDSLQDFLDQWQS